MSQLPGTDNYGRAASWLLFGVAGGLALDLCAKEILNSHSLPQFVFLRSIIGMGLLLALAPRFFGGLRHLRTRQWRWHLLRSALAAGAMFGFFYGLSKMPLVNALTLAFTAPLMVTALSVPLLGEQVGPHRWGAVVVGFIGTLIMLRPGSGEFTFASAAVLIAAFCYACQAISARHLAASEHLLPMSFYVVLAPLIVSLVFLNDRTWTAPNVSNWLLIAGAGVGSVIAWVGFINGYRSAPPALLAPLEYSALIAGAIAGFVFWSEVPDIWVVVGAAVIIGSGMYVVYREISHRPLQ